MCFVFAFCHKLKEGGGDIWVYIVPLIERGCVSLSTTPSLFRFVSYFNCGIGDYLYAGCSAVIGIGKGDHTVIGHCMCISEP